MPSAQPRPSIDAALRAAEERGIDVSKHRREIERTIARMLEKVGTGSRARPARVVDQRATLPRRAG